MFTIDLLKGENLPVRTKPQGVAIFVATFAVPALAIILMAGFYIHNEVIISVQRQNIKGFEIQTHRLDSATKLKESFEEQKAMLNSCLADVSTSIHRHTQWSPILVTVVENLPKSVVLTSIEVKKQTMKRKGLKKSGSNKKEKLFFNTLKLRVSGEPTTDCDIEVKNFRERIRASSYLGSKLEDVVIASQGHDNLDGRDVVTYDIDCIFKPGV